MRSRTWVIRGFILLAVAAPLAVFVLGPQPAPESAWDLRRVYDAIPDHLDYKQITNWCGLRRTVATASETAAIKEALQTAPASEQVWCIDRWKDLFSGKYRPSKLTKWVRIHHSTDPDQWVGIGVLKLPTPDRTYYWIVCRVAVGF
jgi:hypothetical protein